MKGKESWEKLETARKELAQKLDKAVGAMGQLLGPLKGLDDDQKAAVVALVRLTRTAMLAERPAAKVDKGILQRFEGAIYQYCPDLKVLPSMGDPCFEATLEYLKALKSCKDEEEPRDEDECWEAHGPGGAATECAMKELEEAFPGILGEDPFPQPIK